jgi:hypothetical protein
MKEPLEYVYFRNMSINGWLRYSSKSYDVNALKEEEEENDIPFEDIGKSFNEITDYVLVGTNINPNENYDKLISENQILNDVDGIPEYLEKLSKDVYFPA